MVYDSKRKIRPVNIADKTSLYLWRWMALQPYLTMRTWMCIVHLLIYNVRSFSHIFILTHVFINLCKEKWLYFIFYNNTKTTCTMPIILHVLSGYIININKLYKIYCILKYLFQYKYLRIMVALQYRSIFFLVRSGLVVI